MSAEDSVGPYHPSRPEESIPELPTSIPDPDSEKPAENERLPENLSTSTSDGDLAFPAIVLGCAVFGYGIYFAKDQVLSDTPVRLIRYALRCGINAFDTSPWYHPSEIILGRVFKAIEAEFPRESYTLITKVGKYGPKVQYHTYDAASVKASVERSLKRMNTSYLDAVYLHDVEFVTSHPFPFPKGDHRALLTASATGDDEYRLSPPYEPLGPGDAQILEGLAALKELQKEGKVRKIGIAGFPLPLLLRLSHLAANTPSVGPLDLVQTYGQQTVQNPSLEVYLPEFKKAGVRQIMNAAPLSMGILTTGGGPDWHPVNVAKGPVYDACREASQLCQDQGTSIEEVAVNFAYKGLKDGDRDIPVVIGCKVIDELKRTIKGWRAVNVPGEVSAETRAKIDTVEKQVEELFERKGVKGWSWQSPSPGSL